MAPSPIVRYVLLVLGLLVSVVAHLHCLKLCSRLPAPRAQITTHYILSFSHEEYGRKTSISNLLPNKPPYKGELDKYYGTNATASTRRKANAAFVVLARNGDLPGLLDSLKQMEDRFNKKFQYPYVFLNEEDFSDDFKKCVAMLAFIRVTFDVLTLCRWTTEVTSTKCSYGKIPREHWFQPGWIDEEKATKSRLDMIEHKACLRCTPGFSLISHVTLCHVGRSFMATRKYLILILSAAQLDCIIFSKCPLPKYVSV
jgi:alpha 1,2-mannosyltransferase